MSGRGIRAVGVTHEALRVLAAAESAASARMALGVRTLELTAARSIRRRRLRRAERALKHPFTRRASLALDRALIATEEPCPFPIGLVVPLGRGRPA